MLGLNIGNRGRGYQAGTALSQGFAIPGSTVSHRLIYGPAVLPNRQHPFLAGVVAGSWRVLWPNPYP